MSHGNHMNESWQPYEWVMALVWMSDFTRMNDCPGLWAQWVQCMKKEIGPPIVKTCRWLTEMWSVTSKKMWRAVWVTEMWNIALQHTPTHCNNMSATASCCRALECVAVWATGVWNVTLQHNPTHCNNISATTSCCRALQYVAVWFHTASEKKNSPLESCRAIFLETDMSYVGLFFQQTESPQNSNSEDRFQLVGLFWVGWSFFESCVSTCLIHVCHDPFTCVP